MGRSIQPADLFLGHYAFDILALALDTVTWTTVGLDRQTADDGINAAFLGNSAALRALLLVVNVVIDSEIMGHRLPFPLQTGF
jgi:hypothetical protein